MHCQDTSNKKEKHFLQLLESHKGILYKICRIYQDQEERRKDLFQEMILQLWSSFDSFRGESQFSSWMYQVAFNTAIVFWKKEKRDLEAHSAAPYQELHEELHKIDDRKEQLEVFYKAVKRLNTIEKAIIFLYMQGLSGKEIADILGISTINVRVRLNRVKEKIKDIIKTLGYEF